MIKTIKHWFKPKPKPRKASIDTKNYSQVLSELLIELGYEDGLNSGSGLSFVLIFGTEQSTQLLFFEEEGAFILMEPYQEGWVAEEVAVCSEVSEIKTYHQLEEKGTLEFAFKFMNPFDEEEGEPTEYAYVYRLAQT